MPKLTAATDILNLFRNRYILLKKANITGMTIRKALKKPVEHVDFENALPVFFFDAL